MSVRSWSYPVLALLVLVFGGFAASTAQAEGNAAQGKLLGYTCLGCHGVDNYRNAYPNYSVPKLVGQHPEYLVIALNEYKSGERSHGTMHAQASSFSDQDMLDLSLYLAGEPVKSAAGAKPAVAPPAAVATCSACHGTDGVGIVNIYPTLAGQHADYIEQALNDYRAGRRRNAVMSAFAAALKPADIKAVALYFSQQKPALQTLARPTSRYSAAAK